MNYCIYYLYNIDTNQYARLILIVENSEKSLLNRTNWHGQQTQIRIYNLSNCHLRIVALLRLTLLSIVRGVYWAFRAMVSLSLVSNFAIQPKRWIIKHELDHRAISNYLRHPLGTMVNWIEMDLKIFIPAKRTNILQSLLIFRNLHKKNHLAKEFISKKWN